MQNTDLIKNIDIAIEAALMAGKEILNIYYSKDFEIQLKSDNSPLTIADKNANKIIEKYLSDTSIPILSEEGKETDYNIRKEWNYFWLVDPLDGTKEFIKRNDEFTVNIALILKDAPIAGVIYVPVLDILYLGIDRIAAYRAEKASSVKDNFYENFSKLGQKLPLVNENKTYTVVGSRSHMNEETEKFFSELKKKYNDIAIISKGSSLKICMVAEGKADIYPRFGPTMEWDTAAGHAIVIASGGEFTKSDSTEFFYNKENLLNPWFIVKKKDL